MKVSRSIVAALIGATLLILPAGGVGAQDASEAPAGSSRVSTAALVTGWFTTDRGDAVWTEDANVENGRRQRGGDHVGRTEMSDPRLSGDVTATDNADRFCDGRCSPDAFRADVLWGAIEIANDAGTWVGTYVGTSDVAAGGSGVGYYAFSGTGAYEGLSAVMFETEVLERLAWSGVIFPGDLPPDR